MAKSRSRLPGVVRNAATGTLNWMAIGPNVSTGANFRAGRSAIISAPHQLTFGNNVSIGPRSVIQVDGQMGDYLMVGMNVHIVGRDDHAIDEIGTPMLLSTWSGDREQRVSDTVTIGDDVWIGASATILSGVTIGHGAVIGAGAVVISDVADFAIAVGVPAREVGKRFENGEERARHLSMLKRGRASETGVNSGSRNGVSNG